VLTQRLPGAHAPASASSRSVVYSYLFYLTILNSLYWCNKITESKTAASYVAKPHEQDCFIMKTIYDDKNDLAIHNNTIISSSQMHLLLVGLHIQPSLELFMTNITVSQNLSIVIWRLVKYRIRFICMTVNRTLWNDEVVFTGSFAGCNRGRIDLDKASVTMTFIGTFDVDAELWAVVASPACTFINVCMQTHRHNLVNFIHDSSNGRGKLIVTYKQIGKSQ